jgi:hypothetical protein
MTDIIIIKNADEETIKKIINGNKNSYSIELEEETIKPKSIDERKELIRENYSKNKTNPKNKSNKKWDYWTKQEDKIVKTYFTKNEYNPTGMINWKELIKNLPERTYQAIKKRANKLKLGDRHRARRYSPRIHSNYNIQNQPTTTPKKGDMWTKQEIDIVKNEYEERKGLYIDWKRMKKLLPNRTKSSIYVIASELKLTNRHRNKKPKKIDEKGWQRIHVTNPIGRPIGKKHREFTTEERKKAQNTITQYREFMKKRKNQYQKYGYKEHDSYRMSLTDWHRQKRGDTIINLENQTTTTKKEEPEIIIKKEEVKIIEEFPKFETISKDFGTLIESMTKYLIANCESRLTFLNSKNILDIENGRVWHDFVVEFMSKSQLISDYFNVSNNFKHIRNGDFDIIIYEQ